MAIAIGLWVPDWFKNPDCKHGRDGGIGHHIIYTYTKSILQWCKFRHCLYAINQRRLHGNLKSSFQFAPRNVVLSWLALPLPLISCRHAFFSSYHASKERTTTPLVGSFGMPLVCSKH